MANPASDELVAVEIADLRDEVTSLQAKLDEAAKAYTSLFSAFLAAQSEREAEKARADKAEAERDAIDRSRTFHAARATTAEAAHDRLAAVVAEARKADVLIAALEFYANPAVYAPHPHGPAFDRRDISFKAKNALAEYRGDDELPPNFAACCNSTDLAACDCVHKQHIRVLFAKGGRKYQPTGGRL